MRLRARVHHGTSQSRWTAAAYRAEAPAGLIARPDADMTGLRAEQEEERPTVIEVDHHRRR